jgi:heat shock protein 5
MTSIIPKNTAIPTKKTQIFTTNADNQSEMIMQIYEGERVCIKDDHLLGKFTMNNIPLAPKGETQIEVTFQLMLMEFWMSQ